MFRRSSIIFAASLALLSTFDSATCFAAPAPAQPREDLDRPRFLKKEIKRFVFSNVTTSSGGPLDGVSTSDLEALHDTLTSSSLEGADATPTSATSAITTTQSVTPLGNGQSSTSDVLSSSVGDADGNREAFLALHPATTAATTASSTSPPSSSQNSGEGATTQSSSVAGGDSATGSSHSLPSSSASQLDQSSVGEAVPQITLLSTTEQRGNGVTSSQPDSTALADTSAFFSSTAVPASLDSPRIDLEAQPPTSSSTSSQNSVSNSGEQSPSTSSSPAPPIHTTSSTVASETSVSNSGEQAPSTSSSQMPPSSEQQTDTHVQAKTSQGTDALQSTSASEGAGASSATTSNAKVTSDSQVPGVSTSTDGAPVTTTLARGSSAAVPGGTTETSAKDTSNSSPPGEATSGVPGSSTRSVDEGPANTNTNVNGVASTTAVSGAGAITTHAAEPASSAVAPQFAAVVATGTSHESETSHTSGSEATQPSLTAGSGVASTSQNSGPFGSSTPAAVSSNPVNDNTNVGASLASTTLADGSLVPIAAQTTGAVGIAAPSSEILPASASSPGGDQNSTPNPSAVTSAPASVPNPSVVAAASKLNAIPASVENPLASVSGNPSLVFNPALTSAASLVDALPASIKNPEHQISPAGPSKSAPPVIPGGSSAPGGVSETTAGGTNSPVGTESPSAATAPLISGTESPVGTGSPVVSGSGSPVESGTGSPVVSGTGSPVMSETTSPVGGTGSLVATGSAAGETGLSSGEPTAGQVSGQSSQNTALGSSMPGSGPITTASNGEVISGTPAPTPQSATAESGIAGYSTQSNGQVVPVSAAAGTGSSVSNGQIVPAATDQSPGPSETGGVAASIAAQSAAAAASGATQNNAVAPGPTSTPAVPPPQKYYGKGPYTQSPVGYDTSTTQSVPTSILHGPSSTPSATQGHYFGPSSLPSNVPQILYQNGGPGSQPANTRMINIAFRSPLNYLFVYNNTVSQQQIFYYIPFGICYGLEIDVSQVTMQSLRAWDTYEDVGYVTTLAEVWISEGLVDNLGLLVSVPVSRFYRNPDNSTAFLLSMINNAIPITGSNGTDGGSAAFGNVPADTTTAKTGGAPIGGDIGNSEHVRASSVGIGVGVACGAAAYGAAMFFVAKRYKKRRQSHLRSPSMFNSPVMSHAGPDAGAGAALMSGAMGERSASPYYDNDGRAGSRGSGRSGSSRHQISAPVMAENSLGWN